MSGTIDALDDDTTLRHDCASEPIVKVDWPAVVCRQEASTIAPERACSVTSAELFELILPANEADTSALCLRPKQPGCAAAKAPT